MTDQFQYPTSALAHTADPDTSHAAAAQLGTGAKALRERIYRLLAAQGPKSAEQVATALDVTHLQAMKRLSDLKNLSLIEDSGQRSRTVSGRAQIVWRAA